MPTKFTTVFPAEALENNKNRAIEIDGASILICNADGQFFAVENVCPHQLSPLEGGRVRRGTILCPLHGMPFDLRSGEPKGQLTNQPLRTFEVRVTEGMVEIGTD